MNGEYRGDYFWHQANCLACIRTARGWGFNKARRAYWQHMAAFHRQEAARLLQEGGK